MDENVAKAVERMDIACVAGRVLPSEDDWQTIRAHMLAREAEVERLTAGNIAYASDNANLLGRAMRAEALLREALGQVLSNIGFMAMHNVADGSIESAKEVHDGITAHLSENSRG